MDVVAVNANGGSLGLTGWWKVAGNATAMTVIAGSFLFLQYTLVSTARQDRYEDRQMFRDSLDRLYSEQNRHSGEIKGAMDANNAATRDLTSEIRSWRKTKGEP